MKVYTVIDTETTGLDAQEDQITELAMLKVREDGKVLGSYQSFVRLREGNKPHPKSKVTEEDCEFGIDEYSLLDHVLPFATGSTLIMQYAPFDLSFLNRLHNDDIEQWIDYIDTRTLAKIADPTESPSLEKVVNRYGIKKLNHHRAMDDCKMTWEVFKVLKDKVPYPRSKGFRYWYNTVMDFDVEGRRLKYTPKNSRVLVESKGWGY